MASSSTTQPAWNDTQVYISTAADCRSTSFCPDGYCRHSDKCYLVVGLNATWMEARNYCTVLGGALLSVRSQAEQNAVEGVVKRSQGLVYPGNYWLDATDLLNPGDWKWMADKTALSYSNWLLEGSGYNTTYFPRNCVDMWAVFDYEWTTANCMDRRNFVCYKSG